MEQDLCLPESVKKGKLVPVLGGAPELANKSIYLGAATQKVVFTGDTSIVDALVKLNAEVGHQLWKKAKAAARKQNAALAIEAIEQFVLHPDMPLVLGWGRNPGNYHGEHIVRKVWVHLWQSCPHWKLFRADVLKCGTDVGGYVRNLPVTLHA